MVNISIFIEGGVLPNDNLSALTIENSERLREGFYMLFSQFFSSSEFNIVIKPGSGDKQTINFFKERIHKERNTLLLIDLDRPKIEKDNKLSDFSLTDYSNNVFFMVQEMEAWIISQIDKVDEHYRGMYIRKHQGVALSEHKKIVNIHPEDLTKPSIILKEILGYYFSYKGNKKRNKKYGKLKDGADLLSILDAKELQHVFSDFNNLILKIEKER